MKTAFLLFFILMFLSTYARAQQTFNSVKIKDLELPNQTASKVLYLNGSKKATSSTIGTTELEYLSGVTSAIQTQLDAKTTDLSAHESDTTTHGASGAIVGTTDTQTLTNKTISGASIESPSRLDPKKDTFANLTTYATTAQNGELVYSTDTKAFYTVTDGALVAAGGGVGGGDPGILSNSGFEEGSTDWTLASGSSVPDTSSFFEGDQSLAITLSVQTLSFKQSSALNAAALTGLQGLGYIFAKAPAGTVLSLCAISAGVTSTSLCHTQTANGTYYQLFKIPFTLGATSNGIELKSSTVVTGVVNVEKSFLGAVDLKQDVDQSRIAGESYWAGTTGCTWLKTSTTLGAFGAVAACPGPTIVDGSMGSWQATDSDLPRQTINNLPAGKYKATFIVSSFMSAAAAAALTINDGTTSCEAIEASPDPSYPSSTTVSCVFYYVSSGNRGFELYGASASSTINLPNNRVTPRSSVRFNLEYFGSGSVYSSTSADTDWAACNFSTLAWQGLGTVTATDLRCKRSGSDLLMSGKLTLGTTSAIEARFLLPIFNGTQLSVKSGIDTTQRMAQAVATASVPKDYTLRATGGNSYLTFGYNEYAIAVSPITARNGDIASSSSVFYFENIRIPINNWENSNVIVGSFNEMLTTPGVTKPVFRSAILNCDSASSITSQKGTSWVSSIGNIQAGGDCTVTLVTGSFSDAPNCNITRYAPSGFSTGIDVGGAASSSTSVFIDGEVDDGTSPTTYDVTLNCFGGL